jgi:hypothetical protein
METEIVDEGETSNQSSARRHRLTAARIFEADVAGTLAEIASAT